MSSAGAAEGPGRFAQLRHDLRTPINQILGYSELLEEELQEAAAGLPLGDLQRIQQAARGMLEVIARGLGDEGSAGAVANPLVDSGPADGPYVDRPATPLPSRSASASAPAAARPRRSGHLLVVDDQPLNRELLRDRLQREGYSVAMAEDGLQALEKVRRSSFDLILLDVMMPGLDGYSVLQRLKQEEELRDIPVIMISAIDELASVVTCIEHGAEEYLPKPFNPTLLRARIGACLEKKALRDQEKRIYRALVASQEQLAQELERASRAIDSLPAAVEADAAMKPVLAAFRRMSTAVARRETQLREQIRELEIELNPEAVQGQVGSILADPSFQALSERARALRQRRQQRMDGNRSQP
ncbi:MAG: response regulator [Synechococcus sp.]|nr:response regulator [Synechococcus sp.]